MRTKSKNIENILPLLAYEDDFLISKSGDATMLFELQLPEVFSLGRENFDNLHSAWMRAMKCLPDYSIVHKQDFFTDDKVDFDKTCGGSFLNRASDNHFRGRKFLRHRSYLYLTLSCRKNMSSDSSGSILCRSRVVPQELCDIQRIKSFKDSARQFCDILSENGVVCRALTREETIGSKDCFGLVEHYLCLDFSTKAVLPDMLCKEKDFIAGDNYVSCYSISELDNLPMQVSTFCRHDKLSSESTYFPVSYAFPLGLELPFAHIYNQYFFLDSHKEVTAAIEKRGREQQSLSGISRENAINKQFNDQYLNEAVIYARRSVRAAANIILWDKNYLRLQKKNSKVGSVMANMDCSVNKTEGIVPQIFWGGIPGAASQFPSDMTFLTFLEQACCFILNETLPKSKDDGFGIRLCDRIFGTPLKVDISDYPREKGWIDNRNKFILGPSGSGKSFFTNHLTRQYYEQGAHVLIVDVGDSYQGLCKLINEETHGQDGVYFTYTEETPISFNPFFVADMIYTVEKREQLASLIFCLWKNENELITKAEETHIATAINGYIESFAGSEAMPSFNGFYEFLSGEFRDHVEKAGVDKANFDLSNLLQVLRPYYKGGMYDFLLNATENPDLLHKRFIVFEIDNIKDHKTLFPVVTLILMDTFISKMRHPSLSCTRKMILIEEAWKAISKNGTAEFIKYLYKTVRKHFGEAMVVTQEVDDIVGNEIVKSAIISNADCKILLDQRKYANRFDEIRQILALSEKETAIALSVNRDLRIDGRSPYKEVFISLNGNYTAVYGVEVSREEYLAYTTEKKEKARLMQTEKQTGSMIEAIRSCAAN